MLNNKIKVYIGLKYPPTEQMWAEDLNKIKQVKDYHCFRSEFINVSVKYKDYIGKHGYQVLAKYHASTKYQIFTKNVS